MSVVLRNAAQSPETLVLEISGAHTLTPAEAKEPHVVEESVKLRLDRAIKLA